MESVIAVVVGLMLIWIGFKIVKLIFKLILWGIAILLILAAIGYYFNPIPSTNQLAPKKEKRSENMQPIIENRCNYGQKSS